MPSDINMGVVSVPSVKNIIAEKSKQADNTGLFSNK